MASILILSIKGDAIPIAFRLAQEGHICKMWFKDPKVRSLLEGSKNPSRINDSRKMLDQYDLVLSDYVGLGLLCDELKEKDKLVLGGGIFNDKLNQDLEYAEKVCKSLLKISFQPNNQELEISTEGWFNGHEWIKPFNHSFKQRRLMEGDKGPIQESMGDVLFLSEDDKLIQTLLIPLTNFLRKVNYIGPLTVSCSINQEISSVRFTPGFSYDSIKALTELLKEPLFNFLYSIASRQSQEFLHSKDLAMAVRLSIDKDISNGEFLSVPDEAKKHFWSGVNPILGCCTARGENLRECKRRVYRTIQNIILSKDVQFRRDIGDGIELEISKLREWGWLE